jgi:hypothetical protein
MPVNLEILNLAHNYKLAKKAFFTLKERIMYKMCKCLTTLEAQIVLKKLHERMAKGHFVVDIITQKILGVGY